MVKQEKDEIISRLMDALKKEKEEKVLLEKQQEEYKKVKNELDEKTSELRDIEKEYMKFMREVAIHGKSVNVKTINMFFIQKEYTDALNYKDLMDPPLTEKEKAGVRKYGGVRGVYDIIYGRCIENVAIEKRPFHCVDNSRNKYLLREKNKWGIDNKGEKILDAVYPKVIELCIPNPADCEKNYGRWKLQNKRMNDLANGRGKIIKMLNRDASIKNAITNGD